MKIFLTSDVHRGFTESTHKIHNNWAKTFPNDVDVVVLAGDLGTCRFKHTYSVVRFFRQHFPKTPIVAALGNHDFWDKGIRNFFYLQKKHQEMFEEFDVHWVENGPFVHNSVMFTGWDGWYARKNIGSNDPFYIPKWIDGEMSMDYLTKRAEKGFRRVVDEIMDWWEHTNEKPRATVVVTHFPFVPTFTAEHWSGNMNFYNHLQSLNEVDAICMGHSHKAIHGVELTQSGGKIVKLYNSGSDYDKPKFITFDV